MDSSPFELKQQIKDAIDIVDLASRYIPSLRRQGRNYVGRCPWHDDRRPSLQINPERQTFKCWVCNIGGDIFTFIMQIENVDFKEALEMLADMAGIALPEPKLFRKNPSGKNSGSSLGSTQPSSSLENNSGVSGSSNVYRPEEIAKPVLYRSLEWLTEKYHQAFLRDPEAEDARQYIRDRGISDEMIRRFKIGYAPLRAGAVLDWIESDRNRVRILETAGVLVVKQESLWNSSNASKTLSSYERDSVYDRFRGRVLFPIRDTQERTVAFGGRLLPGSPLNSPAKYVNSPETPIFTKSKMLFGLDMARNAIRKKKQVIITEGYTDCLMAHQFGFDETVAVLGTALGEEHIKILNRFADRMILVLDGDNAGRKRADEVLGLFVAQGADMSILTLPDDDDPCEYLLEFGAESFAEQLKFRTVDAMDHAFQSATDGIDMDRDIVGASRALDHLLEIIALCPKQGRRPGDPVRLRMTKTIQRLSQRFRISEEEIRRSLRAHRQRLAQRPVYADRLREENREGTGGENDEKTLTESEKLRNQFTFPNAEYPDETDEILASAFEKFPADLWKNESLLPNNVEREFLEFWFSFPDLFGEAMESLHLEDFHSPITRQLFLLGEDLWKRTGEATFSKILLRYDDEKMKNFLVAIDESADEKRIKERFDTLENRRAFLTLILRGFSDQKLAAAKTGQISDLREESLSGDEKDRKLLEILNSMQKKQEEIETPCFMEEADSTQNLED